MRNVTLGILAIVFMSSVGWSSGWNQDGDFNSLRASNTISSANTITSSYTLDLGWVVMSASNTACNTTCVSACVLGQETTSKAILACTDATADVCLCAGAS